MPGNFYPFNNFLRENMAGDKNKILVVEDNYETQLIIKVALRDKFDVELTGNADEAIKLIKSNLFDLVLLDINLNGESNGKDILEFIRSNFESNNLKVVVMTAYDLDEKEKDYFTGNADGFLPKPIDKNSISAEVNKFFEE
jgi:CheY-like chemotaxis protein